MDLYTRFDMPLSEEELAPLRALVMRRANREPLAYILGSQPFRQLELTVSPAVLVPRPETEELLDHVFKEHDADQALRVVDIGTGSGAIALACAQERPNWQVSATDLSADALAIAAGNAKRHSLQVTFSEGHLGSHLDGGWNIVIANLPYIAEDERDVCDPELEFEPQVALFAPDHGMALIRELIADADRLLAPAGVLWLEHGWQQGEAICSCASDHGLNATIISDGGERDRIARISRD